MLKEVMDPFGLNRMINALLMMFLSTFFWGWLNECGLPINLFLAVGVLFLTFDIKNYSENPQPKALLLGAAVMPFWPILRFGVNM
ncbi:hypothetical protein MIH18_02905 [Marinobacter sp. M3C]|jgi:hypothetical protein|uniref:hypothetical protein n=1 Tax=Marinobacter sp. M3C TaxID=2917715 RepID=UPI00200F0356|nr:hypothetical protein [Marinobacter sp. M3C]UQG60920.1 hypothetical protein MIH18_02905 [Marinobacter sp. M3C]